MPHNQPCPACGCLVPDWHWEWHAEPGYSDIYRGSAGMECPSCGAVVMHTGSDLPLTAYERELSAEGMPITGTHNPEPPPHPWQSLEEAKARDQALRAELEGAPGAKAVKLERSAS